MSQIAVFDQYHKLALDVPRYTDRDGPAKRQSISLRQTLQRCSPTVIWEVCATTSPTALRVALAHNRVRTGRVSNDFW